VLPLFAQTKSHRTACDMTAIITVEALTKYYGRHRGVEGLTFEVNEGKIFGFLGPNGAGKTTTIRVLMGLLRPTAGHASIGGFDCWKQARAVKRLVGYLPGEFVFDPSLTGGQIIEYLANLRGGVDQTYIRQLVERLELDPGKRFREYSHGNKRKVGLIQAFMHRPRLLILDEPTLGLDPLNQQEFYRMVDEIHTEGRTIFLSSHILAEVEHICHQVGVVREGRLVKVDEVAHLKSMKQHGLDISFGVPASPEWFIHLPGVLDVQPGRDGLEMHLTVQGELREVLQVAVQHDAIDIATHEPSLEEVFLRFYTNVPRTDTQPAPAPVER
jgi:ABC-2 type transport system ATP-binding protein